MTIKQFEIPGLAQYSYVISSEGQAVVIDAIRDVDRYLTYAKENNLTITHITETHIHADFAAGSVALAEATGAELVLSGYDMGELYRYTMPHRALKNGDTIEAGSLRLEALHTPGHTPEHLSFVLFDLERSATEPVAIFTGDFLFAGSLGRPDLLGEEAKVGLARELYRSLHQRVTAVPDSVIVYPGHGAGSLCGSGIGEAAQSTLGHERRTQHLFRLSEEEFVREILASVPPMPAYYPRMKRLNAAGVSSIAALPGGREMTPAQLKSLMADAQVTLLDVRGVEEFAAAHIPGALNLGAGQSLSLWAGWLLDAERLIVLVTQNGNDEEEPRLSLLRVGLDRIAGHLPMSRWIEAGYETQSTPLVSPEEMMHGTAGVLLLDVRNDSEWATGHIAEAEHIPLGSLPQKLAGIDKACPVVTVCGSGYRASAAASLLEAHGFQNVNILDGGMAAWLGEQADL
jgi:hydroxyacylglutathione hydrolase